MSKITKSCAWIFVLSLILMAGLRNNAGNNPRPNKRIVLHEVYCGDTLTVVDSIFNDSLVSIITYGNDYKLITEKRALSESDLYKGMVYTMSYQLIYGDNSAPDRFKFQLDSLVNMLIEYEQSRSNDSNSLNNDRIVLPTELSQFGEQRIRIEYFLEMIYRWKDETGLETPVYYGRLQRLMPMLLKYKEDSPNLDPDWVYNEYRTAIGHRVLSYREALFIKEIDSLDRICVSQNLPLRFLPYGMESEEVLPYFPNARYTRSLVAQEDAFKAFVSHIGILDTLSAQNTDQ